MPLNVCIMLPRLRRARTWDTCQIWLTVEWVFRLRTSCLRCSVLHQVCTYMHIAIMRIHIPTSISMHAYKCDKSCCKVFMNQRKTSMQEKMLRICTFNLTSASWDLVNCSWCITSLIVFTSNLFCCSLAESFISSLNWWLLPQFFFHMRKFWTLACFSH